MLSHPEAYKFEALRAKWEAQQNNHNSASAHAHGSKSRRFGSFASFNNPLNPFARRDRLANSAVVKSHSNALPAPDAPPDLPIAHMATMLPPSKAEQRTNARSRPRSQTASSIPLLTSRASSATKPSSKSSASLDSTHSHTHSHMASLPSNNLRSRPPTPHRRQSDALPTSVSSNDLLALPTPTSSNSLLQSKIPMAAKDAKYIGASRMFAGLSKPKASRSHTQPNLLGAINEDAKSPPPRSMTPRKTIFREHFASKTPRFMASENSKPPTLPAHHPLPGMDGLFDDEESELTGQDDSEELKRDSMEVWGSPTMTFHEVLDTEPLTTPTTVKPRKAPVTARRNTLFASKSSHEITQHQLLAPLSPPIPKTPGKLDASTSFPQTPSRGKPHHRNNSTRTSLRRYSQLSPCAESPLSTPSPSSARLVRQVRQVQPPAYWAGRFQCLFDRMRLDTFDVEMTRFARSGKITDTFQSFHESAEELRAKKAFDDLAACCTTDDALTSLHNFQRDFARSRLMPLVAPPVTALGSFSAGGGGGEADADEALDELKAAGRKMSFMDKLRGIARKSSA